MNKKMMVLAIALIWGTTFYAQNISDIVSIKLTKNNLKLTPQKEATTTLEVQIKDGWHINSNKPNEDFLIPSKVFVKGKDAKIISVNYPKAEDLNLAVSEKPVSVFSGLIKIEFVVSITNTKENKLEIPIRFAYQACNDKTCMPPAEVVENLIVNIPEDLRVETNNEVKKEISYADEKLIDNPNSTSSDKNQELTTQDDSVASTIEKRGLFLSLIFIFLGGLALNLTPCVYPLIQITIGYFGGKSEGKTSRLFLLGILYVLGMALTYSVIGVVTSLSGAVFGALLQNKFVIIGIALLFVLLSLSQFGVYEFKLPDKLVMKAGGARGGVFGAFFMGLTMGIVAAPCIGPFVLGLVTYVAAKADPFYGFMMFFVLAVGLGFPYLLLALFSGKIKKLPRAGFWMEGVKHIFGLLLLAMAFYFIDPILPKSIQGYILPVFGILSAIILLVIDKTANNVKGFRVIKIVFSIVVLVISIYALIPNRNATPDWQVFSESKYDSSVIKGERMLVDFYADWCIPCKELDAKTFSNTEVVEELKRFTCYKVDMTETLSAATEKLRNRFKIVGMPTVLIIDSKGNEITRLTGFVDAKEFLKIIKKVN